jgi:SAM-dependent methyltransferase
MTGHEHGDDGHAVELDPAPLGAAGLWDETYRSRPQLWSGRPNPQLVAETAGLAPGRALDLGCGEGADALWLAQQGWTVTALDVSAVALERAAAHAAASEYGRRISWLREDLRSWQPGEQFELVSAQYLHSTALPWRVSLGAAASAVRAGGTLLIVGHHPDRLPPWGSHAHAETAMFYTPEQLVSGLGIAGPLWRLDVAASRERRAASPDGQTAVLADSVLRATRLLPD